MPCVPTLAFQSYCDGCICRNRPLRISPNSIESQHFNKALSLTVQHLENGPTSRHTTKDLQWTLRSVFPRGGLVTVRLFSKFIFRAALALLFSLCTINALAQT